MEINKLKRKKNEKEFFDLVIIVFDLLLCEVGEYVIEYFVIG